MIKGYENKANVVGESKSSTTKAKRKKITYTVIKEYCGIAVGTKIERNIEDSRAMYMVEKGYWKK